MFRDVFVRYRHKEKLKNKNYKLLERFYASLYLIRRTEEEIIRVYPTDKIKSPVHLSIGQEAVSAGVCAALNGRDVVFGTYRGHAMYLARGGSLKMMIAELYGKAAGCAGGRGGSMHLIDIGNMVMGTSAIVGTTIPISAGYAYGLKYRGSDSAVVSFFGDGAVDEGAFHEAMNFAALKKLPMLFVCENNLYAIHSHHLSRHHSDNICERAAVYGMPAQRIGDDIFSIYNTAKRLLKGVRSGRGPAFIECITCRWKEHVGPGDDFYLGYREKKEVRQAMKRDQLLEVRRLLGASAAGKIEKKIDGEIREAFEFAERSPFPAQEELYANVFKE